MILIFAFFGSIFIKNSWAIGISPGNSNQPCVPFWRGVLSNSPLPPRHYSDRVKAAQTRLKKLTRRKKEEEDTAKGFKWIHAFPLPRQRAHLFVEVETKLLIIHAHVLWILGSYFACLCLEWVRHNVTQPLRNTKFTKFSKEIWRSTCNITCSLEGFLGRGTVIQTIMLFFGTQCGE